MKEEGINVTNHKPRRLTYSLMKKAKKIVVMNSGAYKQIPHQFLIKTENWHIPGLQDKSAEEKEKLRNQIKKKVSNLVTQI